MSEQLIILREKNNITQEELGNKLGVTRAAISRLESGDRKLTRQMILSICREFNVNEHWLLTGEGDMYKETDDSLFNDFSNKYKLSDNEKKLLNVYLKLDDSCRNQLIDFVVRFAEKLKDSDKKTSN